MSYFEQYYALRLRSVKRIKQVVALKKTRDLLVMENNKLVAESTQWKEIAKTNLNWKNRVRGLKDANKYLKDINKEINTEYQVLHQEFQAAKQQVYDKMDKIEQQDITISKLSEELKQAQKNVGSYKLLYGVLETLYTFVKKQNDAMRILLDLRSNL